MKKLRLLIPFILLVQNFGYAQTNEAQSLIDKADSLESAGQYQKALSDLQNVQQGWPDLSICDYGVILGNVYNRTYDYDNALATYHHVLQECSEKTESVYSAMHGIAFAYRLTGSLDSSAVWEYRALDYARENDHPSRANLSLQSLAILSYSRGDYTTSNRQALELINALDTENDLSLAGNMYNLVGVNFRRLDELDSALAFHRKALEIRKRAGNESRIASSLNNIAAIYLDQRDGENAMPYLEEAITIKEKYADSSSLVTLYSNIGNAYYFRGIYDQARPYYNKASNIAKLIDFKEGELLNLKSLVSLDTVLNDYKSAFYALSDYQKLSEDILNQAKQRELIEMDTKYETAQKEQQIAINEQQLASRDQFIWVISFAVAIFALLSLYLFVLFRKNKRLSERNELLLKEQNHRVKNNLQMISSLLSLQSVKLLSTDAKSALDESQSRINSVALLHRMLYEGDELGKVNTREYLQTLLEEIKYSAGRAMDVDLHLPEKIYLPIEKATSLGLIVNELVTNSIKHVADTIDLCVNLVLAPSGNGQLHFTYTDNGQGINETEWQNSSSFGHQLIRLQSEQLRGTYTVSGTNTSPDLPTEQTSVKKHGFSYELHLSA